MYSSIKCASIGYAQVYSFVKVFGVIHFTRNSSRKNIPMKDLLSVLFTKNTDQVIIQNLTNAFQDNDRMKALLGSSVKDFQNKVSCIMWYSYFMVKKINGIFTSTGQQTWLLFYRKSQYYFSLKDCLNYCFLAFYVIGFRRLLQVYLRERRVRNIRRQKIKNEGDDDYLYVWFMAQKRNCHSLKGLMEAKQFIIRRAATLHLPIYMETTEKRLVNIYKRIGFQFYDCLIDREANLSIWFGRYDYNTNPKINFRNPHRT